MNLERIKFITAVILYGTIGLFLRYVSIPTEIVVMCRGIIGSVFILAYLKLTDRHINITAIKNNSLWLILSGICLGLNWGFLFAAYMHTTIAIASLCNYMAPLIVILIAPVVLHEKLDKRKLPCVFIAFVGIILVSGVWDGATGNVSNVSGVLLGLASALCFVGIVICNRKFRDISAFDKAVVQLAVSAITILPYVIINNYNNYNNLSNLSNYNNINSYNTILSWDIKSIAIILMLGIVQTGIAYCLYFSGLGSLPVQTLAILGYLEPVVSVLCSVTFLGESMSLVGWLGAILILGAAVVSECL